MNNDSNNHQYQSAIDTYRQHVAARQLYIDKCAVVRSELDSMDQQAIECIVLAYLQSMPVIEFIRPSLKGPVDVKAWNVALEAAASIVCPDPHKEEERDCQDVASRILDLKIPVTQSHTPTHIDGSDSDTNSDSYGDIVQPSPSLSPAT